MESRLDSRFSAGRVDVLASFGALVFVDFGNKGTTFEGCFCDFFFDEPDVLLEGGLFTRLSLKCV
jgi:hypothetical protein